MRWGVPTLGLIGGLGMGASHSPDAKAKRKPPDLRPYAAERRSGRTRRIVLHAEAPSSVRAVAGSQYVHGRIGSRA